MDDLDLLIRAAEAAGDIALKYFRSDYQTWDKEDGAGPVTEADLAVDAMLKEFLLDARPSYGWLSEETEDDQTRLSKQDVFIVDPIDGTRSFAGGENTWAHALAVVRDGRPVAGVVFLPARGKLYAAIEGRATLNGSEIQASPVSKLDDAGILAPRNVFSEDRWKGGVPGAARHFRPSLAYRLALVGEGRFDAMITLRDAWEWDIAAGCLIVEAAGGHVSDRSGRPLTFNATTSKAPGVIAAAPGISEEIAERVSP